MLTDPTVQNLIADSARDMIVLNGTGRDRTVSLVIIRLLAVTAFGPRGTSKKQKAS